jgi:hypothetical protein
MRELIYLLLLAALVAARPLRRTFMQLALHQRVILGLLVLLVFGAQMAAFESQTYPFVRWAMYSKNVSGADWFQYRGVRLDGVEEPLPLADFVRVLGKRYAFRLRLLASHVSEAETEAERREAWELYERTLRAGLEVYQRRHPQQRWRVIEVSRCETDLAGVRRGEPVPCDFLWQLDLS